MLQPPAAAPMIPISVIPISQDADAGRVKVERLSPVARYLVLTTIEVPVDDEVIRSS